MRGILSNSPWNTAEHRSGSEGQSGKLQLATVCTVYTEVIAVWSACNIPQSLRVGNFYKASPPLASTLHFSRHYKADSKNHVQAQPAQGPAWLQWELNPMFCTANRSQKLPAKLEAGVRFNNKAAVPNLQYQKNDLLTLLWVLSMSYTQEPNFTD